MKIKKIADFFQERFSNRKPTNIEEDMQDIGTPLFSKESINVENLNQLDIILRTYMSKKNITASYFSYCFRNYAQTLEGVHPNDIKNRRTNLIRALTTGNITFGRFKEAMCEVLGYTLVDMQFTFDTPFGRETMKLSDDANNQ